MRTKLFPTPKQVIEQYPVDLELEKVTETLLLWQGEPIELPVKKSIALEKELNRCGWTIINDKYVDKKKIPISDLILGAICLAVVLLLFWLYSFVPAVFWVLVVSSAFLGFFTLVDYLSTYKR